METETNTTEEQKDLELSLEYKGWRLYSFAPFSLIQDLELQDQRPERIERLYSYELDLERGHVVINAWYCPMADPYGEYPYEIQFYFLDGRRQIIKEVSAFESNFAAQKRIVEEAMDDLKGFFWRRLSMKVGEILEKIGPLLTKERESRESPEVKQPTKDAATKLKP